MKTNGKSDRQGISLVRIFPSPGSHAFLRAAGDKGCLTGSREVSCLSLFDNVLFYVIAAEDVTHLGRDAISFGQHSGGSVPLFIYR